MGKNNKRKWIWASILALFIFFGVSVILEINRDKPNISSEVNTDEYEIDEVKIFFNGEL